MGKSKGSTKALTFGKALAWSGRGCSLAVNFIVLGQLTFFCTNYLNMSPTLVGTLLLASKLFDGFTDLVGGVIIDKTHTKWGKARPYEWSIIGVWLFTILMFACPDFGTVGKSIWIFVTYTFVNSVFATLLNSAETVYICRAFVKDEDRVKINAYNGFLISLMAAGIGILFPILMAKLGTTREGWIPLIAIIAVPFAIIGIMRFIFVPEVVTEDGESIEPLKAADFVGALTSNHYIYILFATGLLFNLITGVSGVVGSYYFTYVVGDIGAMGLVSIVALIGPLFLVIFPPILKKMTVSHLIAWTSILGIIGNVIKGFAGANMPLLVAGNFLMQIGTLPISYFATLLIIDVMDYHELKTGKRIEGVFGAIYGFATKLGAGVASGLVGVIMGMAGFDGMAAVQTDAAMGVVIALYTWIPAAMFAVMTVLMFLFRLDGKIPEIREQLKKRKEGAAL